jgi:hypothetical protein
LGREEAVAWLTPQSESGTAQVVSRAPDLLQTLLRVLGEPLQQHHFLARVGVVVAAEPAAACEGVVG